MSSGIDELGREHPDPVPTEVPLHMKAAPQLDQLIKNFVRRELSAIADSQQYETFEEADDFDLAEDDFDDQQTPYEAVFDPDQSPPGAPLGAPSGALSSSEVAAQAQLEQRSPVAEVQSKPADPQAPSGADKLAADK